MTTKGTMYVTKRPDCAHDSPRQTGALTENLTHAREETHSRLSEDFDLSVEDNHVPYLNALLLARVLPPFDSELGGLEAAMLHQPKGTMHKLVSTFLKLHKEFDQHRAILLEGFHRRYVVEGVSNV